MIDAGNVVREMNGWELFWSRLHTRWVQFARRLPRLVWYDDELDVVVTFTADRLPAIAATSPEAGLREALGEMNASPIAEIEHNLSRLGIGFDKGMGLGGRDWEWDWSLRGPISVRFRGKARKPERRNCPLKATEQRDE